MRHNHSVNPNDHQHQERRPPHNCPVCGETLALTRLGCQACGTELSGLFTTCEFCALTPDERSLLRVFLTSRGNMKDLERHLGVSYPTARLRVLQKLASGEINVDEAQTRLR